MTSRRQISLLTQTTKKIDIYNIFHILLLKKNTTKKEWIEKVLKLDANNNSKKYKVEAIKDNAVYIKESKNYFPNFYYIII